MGCFCPKNTFLKPKHYIQAISLTLLPTTFVKIHQMTNVIFEIISHFSLHNSSVFLELKNYKRSTKEAHQSANFQTFHCLRSPNSSYHFFQAKSQFFFKIGSFFLCHERYFFCAETLYVIDKSSTTSKCKFSGLLLLTLKFNKFLISHFKPSVSFSSNFALPFSVISRNSSVLSHLNLYMISTNKPIKV